ncbi:type II CAAX endopeptidase family protein [Tissierella sp.]|uniref:type II CAAX endopeptidase family protein n=1 Tax=Tissierella sp. TaxID=41274 RepID=UPI00285E4C8B|nr:type II CAAX endopeptidase family protein [Tissierella sp.]MDR7856480.1 type II CAAX endopeptidase family protein [Tissierella sp.]
MEELKKSSIFETNILYLLIGIALFVLGSLVQSREIYSGLLITEYIIILLPNLIYLKLRGLSIKNILRLNKISFKQVWYIILITIFSYPIAIFLNTLMLTILSFFGETVPSAVPIPDNPAMYFFALFVIALAPGICEEVMFRGTIMHAYGSVGKKKAIIYSAVLFGLFHLNLQNFIGPTFLGIIFGITVYKTNSIFASMIGHVLNNGIAMTIGYFALNAQNAMDEVPAYEISYQLQLLIALAGFSVLALLSLAILVRLIKRLPKGNEVVEQEIIEEDVKLTHYIPLIGIVILFVVINTKYLFI